MARDVAFRNVFLMTFRTFLTAEQLLASLVSRYRMAPPNVQAEALERWKELGQRPIQQRVLTTIKIWVEDYRFTDEGSGLARTLVEFLRAVVSESPLSRTAKHILEALEKPVRLLLYLSFVYPTHVEQPGPQAPERGIHVEME